MALCIVSVMANHLSIKDKTISEGHGSCEFLTFQEEKIMLKIKIINIVPKSILKLLCQTCLSGEYFVVWINRDILINRMKLIETSGFSVKKFGDVSHKLCYREKIDK